MTDMGYLLIDYMNPARKTNPRKDVVLTINGDTGVCTLNGW